MPHGQAHLFIGMMTTLFCLLGLWKTVWFLQHTAKGRRLEQRFGSDRAARLFRGLMVVGIVLGIMLASGILQPIEW